MQLAHNARQEGRDEVAALRRKALYGIQNHLLHAAHLHFNVEERFARIEFKYFFQAGWLAIHRTLCVDLFQGARAHRYAVEFSVMTNDRLFAAGAADIKFKTIDAMFQGKIEGWDGVFRRVEPGAAMSE